MAAYPTASQIRSTQEQKLQELLQYVGQQSPYYKRLFKEKGIDPSAIRTLEDLTTIPPTQKEHLQQQNEDFLCVAPDKVIEYTATSGTLGSPVTIALTERDLQRLASNEHESFRCAGGSAEDIYQLMLTLDRQFMAGMAYYSGIRKLGAGIIRVGPGVPSLQWETIARLKPTAIVAVPSFIVKLIQYAREHGIDPNASSVRKAICIGENIRNTDFSLNVLGKRITDDWNLHLYSTYASTEMQTAFTECNEGQGGHLQPELVIAELLDDDDSPVADGTPGEITITTLGVEGMPLIRYKTGDMCIAFRGPCACGRHSLRLSPVIGRKKQMIKFKGTTLFAPALFEILHSMDLIREYVAEVSTNEIGTDEVLLYLVPVNDAPETDHKIRAYLQARLRVTPQVKYLLPAEMQQLQFPDGGRKPVRFIDKRGA
ncbi:MAG: phenylacetate--CoA ligase [Sphingobacteriales bacterium SCN 48-20]|uniref:phenylacetate--CoA ligase family protein n=1 Tax=Terrimonas ferruginea TaxID=249 RepID=UPI00086BEE18|nr:AMP-binding protein [Terrimonas ferruginea]MBN8784511.1 AMP-binding protein [Terrimonas ferruginea]ODT94685.1 MAG: phenylacetate--CoA ligase [Sphingobacteriales bacterium SCN 48-20]OJW40539.1 MAG: phenylacetate--CoA ligase [Sphingobacteriales bacterium 48-107]